MNDDDVPQMIEVTADFYGAGASFSGQLASLRIGNIEYPLRITGRAVEYRYADPPKVTINFCPSAPPR